jgi:hypothetical protein
VNEENTAVPDSDCSNLENIDTQLSEVLTKVKEIAFSAKKTAVPVNNAEILD